MAKAKLDPNLNQAGIGNNFQYDPATGLPYDFGTIDNPAETTTLPPGYASWQQYFNEPEGGSNNIAGTGEQFSPYTSPFFDNIVSQGLESPFSAVPPGSYQQQGMVSVPGNQVPFPGLPAGGMTEPGFDIGQFGGFGLPGLDQYSIGGNLASTPYPYSGPAPNYGGAGSINQPGYDISGFGGEVGLGQDFNTAAGGQYAWTGAGVGAPTAPFSYNQWANEAGMYPGGETWPTGSSESAETGTGGIAQPGYDVTNFGGNLSLGNNVESPDIWTNQGGLAQPPPTLDQEFNGYTPPDPPMPQVSTDYGSFSGSSVTPDNPSWEQEFAQNGGFEYGVPMPQVQQGSIGGQPTQSLQPGETSLGGLGSANAGQIGTPAPYTGAGITPWGGIGNNVFSTGSGTLSAGSAGSGFDFGTQGSGWSGSDPSGGYNKATPGTSYAVSGAGTGSNEGGTGGSAAYGSVNAPDIQESAWSPPAGDVNINAQNFSQYSQDLPWWAGSAVSHLTNPDNGTTLWINPTTGKVSYPIAALPQLSEKHFL